MATLVVQSTPFKRNPVNRNFRKWVGCEALAPVQDNDDCFDSYHNEPLSCMGAKASQPTHFLKFRLTGFRLNGVDCSYKLIHGSLGVLHFFSRKDFIIKFPFAIFQGEQTDSMCRQIERHLITHCFIAS